MAGAVEGARVAEACGGHVKAPLLLSLPLAAAWAASMGLERAAARPAGGASPRPDENSCR